MSVSKIPAVYADSAKIRFFYATEDIFNSLDLRSHYRANAIKDSAGNPQLDEMAISQDEYDIVKELLKEAVYEVGAVMFKIAQGVSNSIFFDTIITNPLIPDTIVGTLTTGYVLSDGGTNYSVGDIITVVQSGGAANGKFVVLTIDTGGIILTVEQTEAGSNYAVANDLPTTVNRGSGSGATIDIISVQDIAATDAFDDNSSGFELVDKAAYNTNLLPAIDMKFLNCLRYFCLRGWWGIVGSANDVIENDKLYHENLMNLRKLTFQLRKAVMR
jgi:hypothetical protein